MLLIASFYNCKSNEGDDESKKKYLSLAGLCELGQAVAAQLDQEVAQTYLALVMLKQTATTATVTVPPLAILCDEMKPKLPQVKPKLVPLERLLELELELSQATIVCPSPSSPFSSSASAFVSVPADYYVELPYAPLEDDYNRLGEKLLSLSGLGELDVLGEGGIGWQDRGPVVIVPPPTEPALAMFLAHALVHYLQDSEVWSALYVVAKEQPLMLACWD